MIAVVLDTNALASGFVRRNPASSAVQVVDAWRADRYRLFVSGYILTELTRTLAEPYFRQRLTRQ